MFIIWKMPSTDKASRWDIEVVYQDLVFMRREDGKASSLVDLATGEGMVVKPKKQWLSLTKFRVSDSLNDVLFDRLEGVSFWGVLAQGGFAG